MYYTGVDLHKFASYLTTVDSSGINVIQENIKNVAHNFVQYFNSVPGEHETTVESTMTWYWLMPSMLKLLFMQKSKQIKSIPIHLLNFFDWTTFMSFIKFKMKNVYTEML